MIGPMSRRTALLALSAGGGMAAGGVSQTRPTGTGVRIDPGNFGAKYDGVSDDSSALQRAVDACAASRRWSDLIISGPLALSNPVLIDRPVDRSLGIFTIQGEASGRLICKGRGPFFDSRLRMTNDPVTEYLRISYLTVSGDDGCLLSGKFLRVQIDNCFFDKMRIITATRYIQSLEVSRSRFVGFTEPVIYARGAYDIALFNNHFERAGRALQIRGAANGVCVVGNIFESSRSPCIMIDGVNGLLFNGNYTEYNEGSSVALGSNLGQSRGLSIFGNNLKSIQGENTSDKFEIILGRSESIVSGGNYCSGNLYETGFIKLGELRSLGDSVQGKLSSTGMPVDIVPAGVEIIPSKLNLVHPASPQIPVITAPVTIIADASPQRNTVSLPTSISNGYLRRCLIINESDISINVKAPANGAFLGKAMAGQDTIPAQSSKTLLEYAQGRWCPV